MEFVVFRDHYDVWSPSHFNTSWVRGCKLFCYWYQCRAASLKEGVLGGLGPTVCVIIANSWATVFVDCSFPAMSMELVVSSLSWSPYLSIYLSQGHNVNADLSSPLNMKSCSSAVWITSVQARQIKQRRCIFALLKQNLICSYLPYIQVINTWTVQRPGITIEFHYIYPSIQGTCSDYKLFSSKYQVLWGEPYADVFLGRAAAT